jgi:hypothetical protein
MAEFQVVIEDRLVKKPEGIRGEVIKIMPDPVAGNIPA